MVKDRIRYIPTKAHGEVVGLVSVDDILAALGTQWFASRATHVVQGKQRH